MKSYFVLTLTLMALGSLAQKTKGRKSFVLPSDSRLRQMNMEQLIQSQNDYEDDDDDLTNIDVETKGVALKPDSSKGRLFFKKFFLMGGKGGGQQTQKPQIFIITRPAAVSPTGNFGTSPITSTGVINSTGIITTSPADARGGDEFDDYVADEEDLYEDESEKAKNKRTTYKLVKGKGNQQGLSFVVPSKNMRYFQNNRNTFAVNPSGTYNGGANKMKKTQLSGNVKRKRARNPVRMFVSQN